MGRPESQQRPLAGGAGELARGDTLLRTPLNGDCVALLLTPIVEATADDEDDGAEVAELATTMDTFDLGVEDGALMAGFYNRGTEYTTRYLVKKMCSC